MTAHTRLLNAGSLLLCTFSALAAAPGETNAPARQPTETPPAASATCEVKPGRFDITLETAGVFFPADALPLAVVTRAWTELTVTNAVAHGSRVRAGDALLMFDARGLDRAIADMEAEQGLKQLELARAEQETAFGGRGAALTSEEVERAARLAAEDLAIHRRFEKPLEELKLSQDVQRNLNGLRYEQEELDQLAKMYRADDLTEATEEIVLKRQRDTVASLTNTVAQWGIHAQRQQESDRPRRLDTLEAARRRQEFTRDQARALQPLDAQKRTLELEQKRYLENRRAERLAELKADRALLTLKAPADGIVYYGAFEKGDWVVGDMEKHLQHGGHPPQRTTLMTLVRDGPLEVRAWLREEDLQFAPELRQATLVPKAFPNLALPATLRPLPPVPAQKGWYLLSLTLEPPRDPAPLTPGLSCTVHLPVCRRADALTVPAAAVFRDEPAGAPYVFVAGAAAPERRTVRAGRTWKERTEILDGLKAGERILPKRPDA